MDPLTVISQRANELFRESFTECCRIRDEISTPASASSQAEKHRVIIAKKNLMDSAQLAGQIVRALDSGSTLLALIGLRSLTESLINTKYAFAHPKKVDKVVWAQQVCDDYFKRGNDPSAQKNKLNDEAIAKRSKEIGEEDLHNKTYVGLCNYSHMLVHTGLPNNPIKFEEFTRNGYVTDLTTLHDIREHIRGHFDIKGWAAHEQRLVEFQRKYFSDNK